MARSGPRLNPHFAAEKAVAAIGLGYDLCNDIRLLSCKSGPSGSRLIELDHTVTRDLILPGGLVVPQVPTSIKCDKGERTRFRSDVVSFHQMSEQHNREMSLSGKIPSGLFNAMFDFKGCWQKDAATTRSVAMDGWFIALYNIELDRSQITLSEHVKQDVPSSWDPAALAEFIEKYGTHIIVGVKMGGKDVIYTKQLETSNIQPTEVQKLLKQLADQRFSEDGNGSFLLNSAELSGKLKEEHSIPLDLRKAFSASLRPPGVTYSKIDDVVCIYIQRGGVDTGQDHNQWLSTISQSPYVISMSFVPITSLLSGVQGNGFLIHAVNLFLRYKPPIEELHQFLEFQLPRQWAPMYSDLPLSLRHRKQVSPSLQFSLMGPRLFVNTMQVNSGNRPVTGVRLYLEGKRSDHLAIHLQHLSTVPKILQLSDDHGFEPIEEPADRAYFEPVKWSIFSHVCTAPVRLGYSMVASARIRRSEWEGSTTSSRKSGFISMMISTRFSAGLNPPEKPAKVDMNSAVYPGGPPLPPRAPKMATFVNTKEMVRVPEDPPGYWVVTGAKLCVVGGRISIKVKYSLLTIMSDESIVLM